MSNTVILQIVLFAPLSLLACRQDPGQAALERTVSLRYQTESKASGAGLALDSGLVLTCAHVPLARAPRLPALLAGDRPVEVVFSDPAFDLALLGEPASHGTSAIRAAGWRAKMWQQVMQSLCPGLRLD